MKSDFEIYSSLRKTINSYSPVTEETFNGIVKNSKIRNLEKGNTFTYIGRIPATFGYVYRGLLRAFITDENGTEYNKIFFHENTFPGSMVALLTHTESDFAIMALEQTTIIEINQKAYRQLLFEKDDLKTFHIIYLERNWVIEKEKREVSLVQETATERYLKFCRKYPKLTKRIPDYHIASHIGVTPTQLSRVKKSLNQIKY